MILQSIQISSELYDAAKKVAQVESRSVPAQIEFWAKIGKCSLDNPDLPVTMIMKLLTSKWQDNSDATPFDFRLKT